MNRQKLLSRLVNDVQRELYNVIDTGVIKQKASEYKTLILNTGDNYKEGLIKRGFMERNIKFGNLEINKKEDFVLKKLNNDSIFNIKLEDIKNNDLNSLSNEDNNQNSNVNTESHKRKNSFDDIKPYKKIRFNYDSNNKYNEN